MSDLDDGFLQSDSGRKCKVSNVVQFQRRHEMIDAHTTNCLLEKIRKTFNPLVTNGFSHPYHLDQSTFVLRGFRSNFSFFDENLVSKQNSPRWDAAFCGVISGAILFGYVP